jgi:SET domain-containing protein
MPVSSSAGAAETRTDTTPEACPGMRAQEKRPRTLPAYIVRSSAIHGRGVFARRKIPAGECIVEYKGERIDWQQALERAEAAGNPINHTYFFSLADGRVIDGASRGNAARFINHSCEPNCEPLEHEDGRVFIYSLMDIERGEELSYYYALIYEGRHTATVRRAFPCHCGSPTCTGTMLASGKSGKRKRG